jgi:hypothetical protein
MEREPGAQGYNWATLSLEDIQKEIWFSRLGIGRILLQNLKK